MHPRVSVVSRKSQGAPLLSIEGLKASIAKWSDRAPSPGSGAAGAGPPPAQQASGRAHARPLLALRRSRFAAPTCEPATPACASLGLEQTEAPDETACAMMCDSDGCMHGVYGVVTCDETCLRRAPSAGHRGASARRCKCLRCRTPWPAPSPILAPPCGPSTCRRIHTPRPMLARLG